MLIYCMYIFIIFYRKTRQKNREPFLQLVFFVFILITVWTLSLSCVLCLFSFCSFSRLPHSANSIWCFILFVCSSLSLFLSESLCQRVYLAVNKDMLDCSRGCHACCVIVLVGINTRFCFQNIHGLLTFQIMTSFEFIGLSW